ncbi:MAG: PIN domain-containing protein [Sulfuricaulis sp.]
MSPTITKAEAITTDNWSAEFERSEALDSVLELARTLSAFQPTLGDLFQLHVILDTSVILEDLICLSKTKGRGHRRPAVYELVAKKTFVAYFPLEKVEEVEEKCMAISERYRLSSELILSYWSEYRRLLKLVTTADLELQHSDTLTLAARDPSDLPFLQARHIVGASVIISKDHDILESGAPAMPWSKVLIDLRHYSRKRGLQAAIFLGTGAAILVPTAAIINFFRVIYRICAKLPREALALLAIGITLAFLIPKSRAFLVNAGKTLWNNVAVLGPVFAEVLQIAAEAEKHAEQIRITIDEQLPSAFLRNRPSLAQACYRACVVAGRPLTVEEVWSMAIRHGARSRARDPLKSVLTVLRRQRSLVALPDGRWSAPIYLEGCRSQT